LDRLLRDRERVAVGALHDLDAESRSGLEAVSRPKT
jgi:hypothetical protein